MIGEKICLVARVFDKYSGRAEWIYADYFFEYLKKQNVDVKKIEQKRIYGRTSKIFYDFFVLPLKLVFFRIKGYRIFFFISENQAIWAFLANFLNSKTITFFHDLLWIKTKKKDFNFFYFWLAYWLALKSKKVIFNSSHTKEDVFKNFKIKKRNIIITPIYRELNEKENLLKKEKNIIGYIGSFDERKRVHFLVELAKEIKRKKIRNLEIHIWGKGKINIPKSIKDVLFYKGFAPEKNIEEVYNSFDFFVFPSKYEGCGLPIIEAGMCGKPSFILRDAEFPTEIKKRCFICNGKEEVIKKIMVLVENKNKFLKISKRVKEYYKKNFKMEKNFRKAYLFLTK